MPRMFTFFPPQSPVVTVANFKKSRQNSPLNPTVRPCRIFNLRYGLNKRAVNTQFQMENLCEFSPRFRSDYDQCSGILSLITGQEAISCGFTRSVWLCQNHVKRLQKQNQTSCCFKGETNCSNSSYFTPCPRRLTDVLSELSHYSLGTFLCKNHLDFLDQDPRVTNHELHKPPEKRKVHANCPTF